MTHEEIRRVWDETPRAMASGEPYVPGHEGLKWKVVEPHENEWRDCLNELDVEAWFRSKSELTIFTGLVI